MSRLNAAQRWLWPRQQVAGLGCLRVTLSSIADCVVRLVGEALMAKGCVFCQRVATDACLSATRRH